MNRLADAMSPYLQQHASNPVDWWPWGEEALAQAKRRDVPLLISVGYAACHWCHVMAHESFEDAEVAALVNELTVPIKVDREERPDIDAVYMQATVALTGQGGWPMTVFATPDGTPFFAGTYFPREHFIRLLDAVKDAWVERREDIVAQGDAIVAACAAGGPELADVTQSCPIDGPCPPVSPVPAAELDTATAAIAGNYDADNGGFGGAPKFPTQPVLKFLLDRHTRRSTAASDAAPESTELRIVTHTAERMARGGMYDQLGGGFARYSVDASWTVPHFEKMLYDNALLLNIYQRLASGGELAADDPAGNALFTRVAEETARFIVTELGTDEGGFAAAFDADTDGVEGATYAWTPRQLRDVLGRTDGDWATELFAVTSQGTFERGTSVLQLPAEPVDIERYEQVKSRLLAARANRPQPERDDKVVASWNGLAIVELTGYAAAQRPFDVGYADAAAERAAELLAELHIVDGRLRRVSRAGRVGAAAGILEDYAAVSAAFLARFAATGDQRWLDRTTPLVDTIIARFTDDIGGLADTADDAETLVSRPADPTDGPTPSGWALAADALAGYAEHSGKEFYRDAAWRAVATAAPVIGDHPRFAAGLAGAATRLLV